jgi:uroporphyrin-III C-methyltransferase/precorrin-2 dehydrogenase/sirohydrochlorin ferrochelatase
MPYLPLFLNTDKKNIILIGAGAIAFAKLKLIINFTDRVTIVSKEFDTDLLEFTKNYNIKLIKESFREEHLESFNLVVAATNNDVANHKIAECAEKRSMLINIVDNPKLSNFIFGAVATRGKVTIAISSAGVSPVLTRYLKQKIEQVLPLNLTKLGDFLAKYKNLLRVKLTNLQSRRMFWQDVISGPIAQEILANNDKKAEKLLLSQLENTSNDNQSAVYFIGAGPGDPELISLKAIRLISRADIILHDRLVSEDIFNFIRREAVKINVGKTKNLHRYTQAEINELIKKYALEGKIVARVKGGDPTIFAHLEEEIAIVNKLNIPYQVVPAVTAASGVAAYLGISLTKRNEVRGVKYLTLYKEDLINDLYWQELSHINDSLVFYMSSHNIFKICQNLIAHGKDANTPIILVEQGTTIMQKEYFATLENFEQLYGEIKFKSPAIVIIGEVLHKYKDHSWREELLETDDYFTKLTVRS